MLSFIYRIFREFEREHGFKPNLLQISPAHLSRLKSELQGPVGIDKLETFLGMEIVPRMDAVHPHVNWSAIAGRDAM